MSGERDERGYFLPGHPPTPGCGRKRRGWDKLVVFDQVVTAERWRNVVARAIDDAEAGDRHAREWLSKYVSPTIREDMIAEQLDIEHERSAAPAPDAARGAVWGEPLPAVEAEDDDEPEEPAP